MRLRCKRHLLSEELNGSANKNNSTALANGHAPRRRNGSICTIKIERCGGSRKSICPGERTYAQRGEDHFSRRPAILVEGSADCPARPKPAEPRTRHHPEAALLDDGGGIQ